MQSTYYRVQIYDRVDWSSNLNYEWKPYSTELMTLSEAKSEFKDAWMDNQYVDVRIVKAFKLDDGRERIMEILDFKKGKDVNY
jgi:hypothetical protein